MYRQNHYHVSLIASISTKLVTAMFILSIYFKANRNRETIDQIASKNCSEEEINQALNEISKTFNEGHLA